MPGTTRTLTPANGWEFSDHLASDHRMLVAHQESPSSDFAWYEFGMAHGIGRRLCSSLGAPFRSTLSPDKKDLIFADKAGLHRLTWSSAAAADMLHLDLDQYELAGLWMEAAPRRVYYVLQMRNVSASAAEAIVRRQGVANLGGLGPGELYLLEPGARAATKCFEFERTIFRYAFDASRSILFALTSRGQLVSVDLGSMSAQTRGKLGIVAEDLSLGCEGELLATGARGTKDSGIFRLDYDGRLIRRLSDSGHAPTISTDGNMIAFLANDSVQVASSDGKSIEVCRVEPPLSISTPTIGFGATIQWCPCGVHFALRVPVERPPGRTAPQHACSLLIADTRARQLAVYDARPWDYHWSS